MSTRWSVASPRRSRGQSELLGLVLLFGLTLFAALAVVLVGGAALDGIEESVTLQQAEQSMREADARLSQVAFSTNDAHTLDFSAQENVRVVNDGEMTITVLNGTQTCTGTIGLGAIRYAADDGGEVAYQAGGVWKQTESGSVMLSPPDMQYRNGTFSFQMVNVSGRVEGGVETLQASKNVTASRARSEQFRETFGDPACNPPEKVRITVESDYHRAWGEFFREYIGGNVTTTPAASTATVELVQVGASVNVSGSDNTVVSSEAFSADVDVLGTELSGTSGDNVIYGPTTFTVKVNETELTPWPDGDPDDGLDPDPVADDLNNPALGEEFSYEIGNRSAGTTITVQATSWNCYDWQDTGEEIAVSGYDYDQLRCTETYGQDDITIDSDSNSDNLVLLEDGERVPDFGAAGPEQRNLSEILGDRIDDSGYLDLDSNEVVFLYELSEPNADPEEAAGSDDPDYNDAVVLLTIEEANSVGKPENFAVHVSMNEVSVTKKEGN